MKSEIIVWRCSSLLFVLLKFNFYSVDEGCNTKESEILENRPAITVDSSAVAEDSRLGDPSSPEMNELPDFTLSSPGFVDAEVLEQSKRKAEDTAGSTRRPYKIPKKTIPIDVSDTSNDGVTSVEAREFPEQLATPPRKRRNRKSCGKSLSKISQKKLGKGGRRGVVIPKEDQIVVLSSDDDSLKDFVINVGRKRN